MQKAVKPTSKKFVRQPAFKALEKLQSQPKYWIDRINGAWRAAAASYIECGKALADAKKNLSGKDFKTMLDGLDFEGSKVRKLMQIAGKQALVDNVTKLPPSYTTLFELSQLDDTQLAKLIKKGDINTNLEREAATQLVKRLKGPDEEATPKKAAKPKFSREAEDVESEDLDERDLAPAKPAKGKGKTGTIMPPTKGGLEQNLDNLDGAFENVHMWIELIEKQLGSEGNDPTLPEHMVEKIDAVILELERMKKEYT